MVGQQLPEGYEWAECGELAVPRPADWLVRSWGDGVEWTVSPQPPVADLSRLVFGISVEEATGLHLITLEDNRHVYGRPPEEVAGWHFTKDRAGMVPTGELETVEGDEFTVVRGFFSRLSGYNLINGGASYYLAAMTRSGLDRVHLLTFCAPTTEWEHFQPIAQVMVEGVVVKPQATSS